MGIDGIPSQEHIQNSEGERAAVTKLLARYGHLHETASLPASLLAALENKEVTKDAIETICGQIEEVRNRDDLLLHQDSFSFALKYGLKNLQHITPYFRSGAYSSYDLRGFTFSGADLRTVRFSNADFSAAVFTNAQLDSTRLDECVLNTADLSSIRIEGKEIDTNVHSLTLEDDTYWYIDSNNEKRFNVCDDCEPYNDAVLANAEPRRSKSSPEIVEKYARRGIVLFQEGKPLGYLKVKGERTFLAARTVRNANGEVVLWKGMIYGLDDDIITRLSTLSNKYNGTKNRWHRADVEHLLPSKESSSGGTGVHFRMGRNNLRFIQKADIYDKLSHLVESIEQGQEPMVDIFSGKETG